MPTQHRPRPILTPELLAAVAAYRQAHAYTEHIRPTVEAYQNEIVLAQNLRYADHFAENRGHKTGRITSMKDSWMMDDAQAQAFYTALHAAHLAHGFPVTEVGMCPLLIAEDEERNANRAMIDAAAYITNITSRQALMKMEIYRQMTPLILNLVEAVQRDEQRELAA